MKPDKRPPPCRFDDDTIITAGEIRRRYQANGMTLRRASVFGGWFEFTSADGTWMARVKFHPVTRHVKDIKVYLLCQDS